MKKKNRQIVERMKPEKGKEWLLQQHLAFYEIVIPYVKGKKVLDAGCGYGLGAWIWLKGGAQLVKAYDISKSTLNFAKKNYQSPKIKFEKLDFNKDEFPHRNFFDVVCSIEVIEHLKNYEFYLKNIFKSLKKGGILFLTTPNAAISTQDNQFHLHEFTDKELKALLSSLNFKILKKYTFSINEFSKFSGKYFPNFLVSLVKKLPFYALLVKILCQPKVEEKTEKGEILIYIALKGNSD